MYVSYNIRIYMRMVGLCYFTNPIAFHKSNRLSVSLGVGAGLSWREVAGFIEGALAKL